MEAVECGAACLSMIFGRFGLFVPLEELRYACGVSRDGTKASNLVKAARRYGVKAKGFTMEPEALRNLPLPLIIFWNFNHFVVVEGFGKDRVFLNDPATGPRAVSQQEFAESFTGVALAFETGPDFKPAGRPPSVVAGLLRRLGGSRSAFLFVVLASAGLVVPGLLVPAFSRVFVDYYMIQGLKDWLLPLLAAMVGAAFLRLGLTWMQAHFLLRLQTKLSVIASSEFFWHVLRLPIGFFSQRYGGEIGSRVALNDRIASLVAGDLGLTILNLVTMAIYALIMVQYDPLLTVIGIGFAMVNLLAFGLVARGINDANQKLLLDRGKLTGIAMQGLQMIDSYKASGTENLLFTRWSGYHAKVVNAEQALSRYRAVLGVAPTLLATLSTAAILVIGGTRVMDGTITVGVLFAFMALMASFSAPVIGLVNLGAQLQEAQGYIGRLDDVLAQEVDPEFRTRPPLPPPAPPRVPAPPQAGAQPGEDDSAKADIAPVDLDARQIKLKGQVSIRDLTFGFIPTDPPMISGFSLELAPGSRVALVGGSGSGKSTVGKIVAGLHQPWSGDILFDGVPANDIPREVFRNSLAMVDQDIALFEGTVRDNITLWDETMPEDRIVRAARDALIHDDIAERADSYEHKVQEGGRNFSGGQRQRIEIARALAGNPAVLVLDEATSALDASTEKEMVDNIRRRGCTCIIIAHRLSTIRDCDEIIVLDRGKIAERGTHQSLVEAGGLYRQLVEG
ncbi:MAG: NHLP family bacteriocin export ABC transporter peptidase/permease/ATPase subunit [Alphaproteobacteria bacterium]|nr:NHLP family bacteriocin export ABC transporter peptidase/permease/ATPase subunit [Alphaproteobacteria bacterium]